MIEIEIEKRLKRIEALVALASKEVLNTEEAAALIGISASRVYHLTSEKVIPHYKKGKMINFRKSELEKWMLGDRIPTQAETASEAVTYIVKRNARSGKKA